VFNTVVFFYLKRHSKSFENPIENAINQNLNTKGNEEILDRKIFRKWMVHFAGLIEVKILFAD